MIAAAAAFHFLRPWWLLLLVPAVALWWLQRQRSDTTYRWRQVIAPELLRHLAIEPERPSRFTPREALLISWTIAIVAVAGPTWQREPSPFADTPPPAMIVLRVTPSMETTDLAPSRLERAKEKISDLLALRAGAANGLIAYGGSAHLVLPPTADSAVIATMAQALSPQIMPRDGDRIADAIELARRTLADEPRSGSIVILADTIAPDQQAALTKLAQKGDLPPISLLAMAPPAHASRDRALQSAAASLGAQLVTVTADRDDVASIARRMTQAERVSDIAGQRERWQDFGYWLTPLLAMLILAGFRRGWIVFS